MGRRERNKQIKREAILRAGLNAFLQHGYERATIEQIVAEAGVARGTFYLYYADKLSLFEALVDTWFEPLLELFQEVDAAVADAADWDQLWSIYQDMGTGIAWIGLANRDEVLLSFRESVSYTHLTLPTIA